MGTSEDGRREVRQAWASDREKPEVIFKSVENMFPLNRKCKLFCVNIPPQKRKTLSSSHCVRRQLPPQTVFRKLKKFLQILNSGKQSLPMFTNLKAHLVSTGEFLPLMHFQFLMAILCVSGNVCLEVSLSLV